MSIKKYRIIESRDPDLIGGYLLIGNWQWYLEDDESVDVSPVQKKLTEDRGQFESDHGFDLLVERVI